jgi:hypothetical protein
MLVCPQCQARIPEHMSPCICGHRFEGIACKTRPCRFCGQPLAVQSPTCPVCGMSATVPTWIWMARFFGFMFLVICGIFAWIFHDVTLFHGRPHRRRGRSTLAATEADDAWIEENAAAPDRAAWKGKMWEKRARMEHSSIGAFSRLSLDLIALGAPPELIAGAHRAAQDEIEHARFCFTLASTHLGHPVGPAECLEFARADLSRRNLDRARLAARVRAECEKDGCRGEARAAESLRREAAAERDPWLAERLSRMAVDEERHADLAQRIVAWIDQKPV